MLFEVSGKNGIPGLIFPDHFPGNNVPGNGHIINIKMYAVN
jgi:hypothetical protein